MSISNVAHIDKKTILKFLNDRFDLEEFRTLCFQLGVKYDNLGGEGLEAKMRALVDMFGRREKLLALAEAIQESHPDLNIIPLGEEAQPGAVTKQIFVLYIETRRRDKLLGILSHVPLISHLLADKGVPVNAPATKAADFKAGDEPDLPGDLLHIVRSDSIVLATYDDPSALLKHAMRIAREAKKADGVNLRIGIYSDAVQVSSAGDGPQDIPSEAVNLARRVMNLGDDGHMLASRLVAEYFEKKEFEQFFKAVGKYEVKPRAFIEVYNVADRTQREFGNPAKPVARAPEQVLHTCKFPKELRCSRAERIKLIFCPHVSYAKVVFQFSSEDLRLTCNNQEGEDNTFEFDFANRNDNLEQTFEIAARRIEADSLELVRIYCFDEHGELTSPSIHRWVKLRPRVPPPDKWSDVLRLIRWLGDVFMCWPLWVQLATVVGTLLIAFLLLPVFLPEVWQDRLNRFWEDALVRVYWPDRAEEWEDQIELNRNREWINRGDWEFTGLQVTPQEVPQLPLEGEAQATDGGDNNQGAAIQGEAAQATPTPDIVDGVLLIKGDGYGISKKLGTEAAFYDYDLKFRVKFVKGNAVRWILRADPVKQSWYEFELRRDSGRLSLNGYVYTDAARAPEPLKGSGAIIPIDGCCQSNDEILIMVKVRGYQFSHCVSVHPRPLLEEDERTSIGKDWEAGVLEDTRRFGRFRYGNVGLLGRHDEKEGESEVLLYSWQITPPDALPFCTAK